MADCKTCKEHRPTAESVPLIAYESTMARMERTIKRLWVLLVVAIIMLVASNAVWVWHETQYEDVVTSIEASQESESGNNYAVGGDLIG